MLKIASISGDEIVIARHGSGMGSTGQQCGRRLAMAHIAKGTFFATVTLRSCRQVTLCALFHQAVVHAGVIHPRMIHAGVVHHRGWRDRALHRGRL